MGSSRIEQNLNRSVVDRECTREHWSSFWDVTHGGEVQVALAYLNHGPLSRGGRLVSCTLILRVGPDLPGLWALVDEMPGLATVVASTITNVVRRCIRLWSLLLGTAELEVPCGFALRWPHRPASS
jgi:hypothetical protein